MEKDATIGGLPPVLQFLAYGALADLSAGKAADRQRAAQVLLTVARLNNLMYHFAHKELDEAEALAELIVEDPHMAHITIACAVSALSRAQEGLYELGDLLKAECGGEEDAKGAILAHIAKKRGE